MEKRKIILRSSAIVIVILILGAAILLLNRSKAGVPQPAIEFQQDTWDFGTLAAGERGSHTFIFRNTGGGKLEIREIDAPCSCTTALLSTEELNSQEIGELRVDFRETEEKGRLERVVEVHSNDPSNPVKVLTVKATVIEPYTIRPSRLTFDTNGAKDLELSSPAHLNLQITAIETSSECLSAAIGDSRKVDDRIVIGVKVEFAETSGVSRRREQITIHTNSEAASKIEVPVRISARQQRISVQPGKLFFGTASAGEQITRSAVVSIPQGSPARVERIECESRAVSAKLVQRDAKHTVLVALKPDAPLGRFQDVIKLYTSDPNTPALDLTVYGVVLPK